jgi:aerobic carbon-monoxide dehydrogenase small subunit
MTVVAVTLNGYRIHHSVEPRETLGDFLRDRCRLTSVHLGCEHGACGACTVLVDGVATRSCLSLAITCDERSIETLEAMEDDFTMNVLRKHFHRKHGLQCGFCTPGMLMMARDILLRLPRLDETTLRHQLSGHICRCTGYSGIVMAILSAAQELAGHSHCQSGEAS